MARAALTKNHRLGGLKIIGIYCLTAGGRMSKATVSAGLAPLSHASLPASGGAEDSVPCGWPSPCNSRRFPRRTSVSMPRFSLSDSRWIWARPSDLMPRFEAYLDPLQRPNFQVSSHTGAGGQDCNTFCRDGVRPITPRCTISHLDYCSLTGPPTGIFTPTPSSHAAHVSDWPFHILC